MKNKILILGSTGMLGHTVKKYFRDKNEYEVFSTSRKNKDVFYDVYNDVYEIENILKKIKPNFVINCIGILNKDAEDNIDKAILVNAFLPHYLDKLSSKYDFKLIHISTDCVFEGSKGKYKENDLKDATSIYGKTKALGEVINNHNLTLRTSIIGPDNNENGIGLFKWFMNQKGEINGYTKVMWSGVTTIELAKCIEVSIKNNLTGLHHVTNNKAISKYDLLNMINKEFNKNIIINKEEKTISDKSIISTYSYDFLVPSYKDMIHEMKNWCDRL